MLGVWTATLDHPFDPHHPFVGGLNLGLATFIECVARPINAEVLDVDWRESCLEVMGSLRKLSVAGQDEHDLGAAA